LREGNQDRYILVKTLETFPRTYIKKLIKDAYANSISKVKDERQIRNGLTITKSVSAKKRTAGGKKKTVEEKKKRERKNAGR